MFKCQRCGLLSKHGEKKTMVVVAKRAKRYFGERTRTRFDGSVVSDGSELRGQGFETVAEEAACETCAKIPSVAAVAADAAG